MVVTLEPCSHQGKQPPCTEAIIHSGIRRVVAALPDPNPVAAGGAERLREAGNRGRDGSSARCGRGPERHLPPSPAEPDAPYVALKLATTLDGRIADGFGRSRWISGEQAREYVQWLRAGFDAIGVGGRTARLDDPVADRARGGAAPRPAPPGGLRPRGGSRPAARRWCAPHGDPDARGRRRPKPIRPSQAAGVAGVTRPPGRSLDEALSSLRQRASNHCWWRAGASSPGPCWPPDWWTGITGCRRRSGWVTMRPGGCRASRPCAGSGWALARGGAPGAGRRHPAGPGSGLMFTGIVTAVGTVSRRTHTARRPRAHHRASYPTWSRERAWRWTAPVSPCRALAPGDVHRRTSSAPRSSAPVSANTRVGRRVNLERALRVGTGWAVTWCRAMWTAWARWSGWGSGTTPGCSTSGCLTRWHGCRSRWARSPWTA